MRQKGHKKGAQKASLHRLTSFIHTPQQHIFREGLLDRGLEFTSDDTQKKEKKSGRL